MTTTGWYGLTCWNGLSVDQQRRLIEHGNLPWGYQPAGECPRGAEVEITTMYDAAPGPRFYCRRCAVEYLAGLWRVVHPGEELRTATGRPLTDADIETLADEAERGYDVHDGELYGG